VTIADHFEKTKEQQEQDGLLEIMTDKKTFTSI
jgi:hypothetical protein